jgi:hypothetical protein
LVVLVGAEKVIFFTYVDDKVSWFDHVDVDTWSSLRIDDFAYQLNYPKNQIMKVYWLLPRMS